MKRRSVLVVDDDPSCLEYARAALTGADYDVQVATDGVNALLSLEASLPDVVLTDLRMPRMDGLDLVARIRQRWPQLPTVVLTVEEDLAAVVKAVQIGASNYLVKPLAPSALVEAVERARGVGMPEPVQDIRLPGIVGVSPSIVEIRHQTLLAARSEVNVLIVGATGTGKELVAQAIHSCSPRRRGPFVAHNCAATVPDLCDSQFFGHRRGAFTGADTDRIGLIEQADGGVLFLDELEAMPPSLQAKLLRVLDDGEVRQVGAVTSRRVSVRFVAAMNREPVDLIGDAWLREDLYYRLRGFEFRLAPLADRREDIPVLASHFLSEVGRALSPAAVRDLQRRPWPGNVRELRNCLLAAAALAGTGRVDVHHLPPAPPDPPQAGADPATGPEEARSLRAGECLAITEALRQCCGNRSRAAAILGIDRSTLRRKMRQHGINPP